MKLPSESVAIGAPIIESEASSVPSDSGNALTGDQLWPWSAETKYSILPSRPRTVTRNSSRRFEPMRG